MSKAFISIRHDNHYRHESFIKGLQALGYEVVIGEPTRPLAWNEVAVIWNKTNRSRQSVAMARQGGGALIVCENGYFGKRGKDHLTYAMALDGHNGSGRWHVGGPRRLADLNVEFEPWKDTKGSAKVLIAGQRGIGSRQMQSPFRFENDMEELLLRMGYQPVIREHPGRHVAKRPLLEDLDGCRALVVWSSNCATEALVAGYPVYYRAPHIVTQGASLRLTHASISTLPRGDRATAFNNMSWAQWWLPEIESGEAFDTLLKVHLGQLPAVQEGLGL